MRVGIKYLQRERNRFKVFVRRALSDFELLKLSPPTFSEPCAPPESPPCLEKDFPLFRKMKNDGNSFYRCVMFGLFEQLVMDSNAYHLLYSFVINLYDQNEHFYHQDFSLFSSNHKETVIGYLLQLA